MKQPPKLKRGERFCFPCERVIKVGFADNGEHSRSKTHMENVRRKADEKDRAMGCECRIGGRSSCPVHGEPT